MAWRYVNKQNNLFGLLGNKEGDNYIVNKDCHEILELVLLNLLNEDRFLRTYRRMIGFGEHIRKDLLPLLIHAKNNTSTNVSTKIINTTIKILQNLTIPVECLLSLEQESRTESGRQIIYELNCLLLTSKEIFTDSKNTKAVVDFLKSIIEVDTTLNGEQFDYIENCFQLLRNILHIPEAPPCNVMQNQIIWNLFTQSIDKTMIQVMSYPKKMQCSATMVQLIALMYQYQSVSNLQKLLSFWFEASLSESSEDNESNTSPQNQGRGESLFVSTSDPTSDSSDNGGSRMATRTKPAIYKNKSEVYRATEVTNLTQTREKNVIHRDNSFESDSTAGIATHSSDSGICTKMEDTQSVTEMKQHNAAEVPKQVANEVSEKTTFSDCGYVSPAENERESISTSSNDDETPYKKLVHHKPLQKNRVQKVVTAITPLDKKEIRRKKLVKRSKTTIIHMKGLINYTPTDEDISEVLKEFTVDFLLKGYGRLVENLYSQFLTDINLPIDISHLFWLITYFLKFAVQLELDLELISPVLSFNIISYLVFQGVWQLEELEICRRFVDLDLQPHLRRLHLVVTSIREFLQTIETYQQNSSKSLENRNSLIKLELQMCEIHELKKLFLLLIREYNPDIQSKQYLRDLIVSNHAYLLLLEKNSKSNDLNLNIEDHLKEFGSIEVMRQYGLLLEDFTENGKFVNNCIFTMMHHVAGDLDNLSTLFQLNILKTLSQIWETDYELCDDWRDLIEYVIQSFINYSKNNHHSSATVKDHSTSTSIINYGTPDVASEVSMEIEWSPDENEHINVINNETSQKIHDKICYAIKNYNKSNINTCQNEMKKILESNDMECITTFEDLVTKTINMKLPLFDKQNSTNDDIRVLRDHLTQDKKNNLILWLQDALLEACYAKLIVENAKLNDCNRNFIQPITYYYALIDLPIPLVTWTKSQCYTVKHNIFALLLSKLEFILPGDTGKHFVRIPNNWNANYLFTVAQQLGPIDANKFKSNLNCIFKTENFTMELETGQSDDKGNDNFAVITTNQGVPINSYTPLPPSMDWHTTATIN